MEPKPNILIIMPDQMRGDCLSLEKHPVLHTPNIDEIGSKGAHFTRAYTTCASCIPARRSLLTGQFPATHGMVGYREGYPIATPTLAEVLHDAGFATALAGRSMHQSPPEEPYGFEQRVLGSVYTKDDDYARHLNEQAPALGGISGIGLSCNGREVKPWPVDENLHPTHWSIQQARRLLAQQDYERPLFLVASFYAPHPPLFPPARYLERYLRMKLPPVSIGEWATRPPRESFETNVNASRVDLKGEDLRRAQAGYFGLINHIDDLLPNLLNEFKIRSEKMNRPWVIIFTSDHGEMLGDHYLFRKCEPYEGSSRIPLLIQGSAELGFIPGSQCATPACLEDIMPTLLDLADISIPENIDGKSLVPVLRGATTAVRAMLHAEHAVCYDAGQAYHFLTDGKIKYIWRPSDGSEQLFDLQNDPHELHNLSTDTDRTPDLALWRTRLINHLKNRPEGFSDGTQLIPNRLYKAIMPKAETTKTKRA